MITGVFFTKTCRSDLLTLNECLQDSAERFSLMHIISSGASVQGGIKGNEAALCTQHP